MLTVGQLKHTIVSMNNTIMVQIDQYLDSKKYAWAPSTLKSERARLRANVSALSTDPEVFWTSIQHLKPYSRVTTWTRITQFVDHLIERGEMNGPNQFKAWRKKNARQFKNAYQPVTPTLTFQEAKERLNTLPYGDVRESVLSILSSGMRISESQTVSVTGEVLGKGFKFRRVYSVTGEPKPACASPCRIRRGLRKIGLTPHMLRKICLTELAREGLQPAELCEVAGWSSFNTARSYIAASQTRIKEAFERMSKC